MVPPSFNLFVDQPLYTTGLRYGVHPKRDEITARVQEYYQANWPWLSEQAKSNYLTWEVDHAASTFFPNGREDRVEVLTDHWAWIWVLDDMVECLNDTEAKNLVGRVVDILAGDTIPTSQASVEAVVSNARARMLGPQYESLQAMTHLFLEETCRFLRASGYKEDRMKSAKLGLDEYLEYRADDVGTGLTMTAGFWTAGIVVPAYVLSSIKYKELFNVCAAHFAIVNDLYSFRKEVNEDKVFRANADESNDYCLYNAVAVLLRVHQMTHQQAMEDIQKRLNLLEAQFFVAVAELKLEFSHSARDLELIGQVSEILEYALGGNYYWSSTCARYNKSNIGKA